MAKLLLIDPEKCTGCRTCEVVCSLSHEQRCNPAESRISIVKYHDAGIAIPMTCQNCQEPVCAAVCPTNALRPDSEMGRVVIDYELCIGCKLCVAACPIGGMGLDARGQRVIKCDLCDGDPVCVKFCETGALKYLEVASLGLAKRREAAQKLFQLLERVGGTVSYEQALRPKGG